MAKKCTVFLVLLLCLTLCSCMVLKAEGTSSGKIGIPGYEVYEWDETHKVDWKSDSPLVNKLVALAVAGPGGGG